VPGKRGRKHANDLRTVVDAMLYIAQTGCQWRYLPESFGLDPGVVAVPALVTQRHLGSVPAR
jgi:transposase